MARSRSPRRTRWRHRVRSSSSITRQRLAGESPAQFVVVESGEGVHDRVEVGTDGETVHHEVVADVHDGGDLAGIDRRALSARRSRAAPTPPLRTVITSETLGALR